MEFVMWRAIVSGLVLGCLAGNGAVRVARDGERWTLENAELRVTVDAVAGAITVADKGSRFVWTQMETKRAAFRGVKQIAGGIGFDADFSGGGKTYTMSLKLTLPERGADLRVEADMAIGRRPSTASDS